MNGSNTQKKKTTMSDYIQANTNGRLHDAAEPSLSPLDRSFLYGDSVYEVFRTYDGVLFSFQEHWERLQRSAGAIGLEIPFDAGVLLTEIRRTASAYFDKVKNKGDLYIRLQISRGSGPIGLDAGLARDPVFVLLARRLQPFPEKKMTKGLRLAVARTLYRNSPKTLNPAWKTGNYLNNLLCLREARMKGADDVLMLTLDGAFAEASLYNVFFVRGKCLVTPPAEAGILEGVTRKIVLREAGRAWNLDISEEAVYPGQLDGFDECFLTATTQDIIPVARVEDVRFKVNKRSQTSRLKKMFAEYVEQHNEREKVMKIF